MSIKNLYIYMYMLSPVLMYAGLADYYLYVLLSFVALILISDELGAVYKFSGTLFLLLLLLIIDKTNDFLMDFNFQYILHFVFLIISILGLLLSISDWDSLVKRIFISSLISACVLIFFNFSEAVFQNSKIGAGMGAYLVIVFIYSYRIKSFLRYFILAVTFSVIMYLNLRSAQLAIFFIVCLQYFNIQRDKYKLLIDLLFICGLLLIVVAIYYELFITGGVSNIFTGRGLIWFSLLEKTSGNYIFGTGNSGSFDFIDDEIDQSVYNAIVNGNPHNGFVYYFYNTGIVGFVIYYFLIRRSILKCSRECFVLFGAIFIINMFEGVGVHSLHYLSVIMISVILYSNAVGNRLRDGASL